MEHSPPPMPWVQDLTDDTLNVSINTEVYPLEVLFRTCYQFTDRCYLFLDPAESTPLIKVSFAKKVVDVDLARVAGEFCNELVNQRVRRDIAAETRPIRELIVAQAFAEADLLDRSASESDYCDDPKGITK
jgi:His-Xaa-Ser system protein HxsD